MPNTLTANQLVAYNLMRIRKAHGLSQEQAAERIERYLGVRWSKAVYSAAERSYVNSGRIRQFTADDLYAFSMAFGVPLPYFFLPAETDTPFWRMHPALTNVRHPAYLLRMQELGEQKASEPARP